MKLYFLSILFVVKGLTACSNGTGDYENVSTDQAKELIDQKEVVVIDVRTPEVIYRMLNYFRYKNYN